MEQLLHFFQSSVVAHGSIAIFLIGIAEDILFFIPSSLVFMGAGFVLVSRHVPWWEAIGIAMGKVGLPATLGVTFGAIFVYGAVYKLGKPVVVRYGKYLGVAWRDIERFQDKWMKGYSDEVILFIARALPIFPLSVASIASGLVRMPWREFMSITLVGVFFRATLSAFIGWKVGKAYEAFAAQFKVAEEIVLGLLLVALIVFWYRHRKQRAVV